jgi:PIN domain nuclease of toxin-antitoxin system
MPTICDTHVLLYWADRPERLTAAARAALDAGRAQGDLACCDISFWEIALLFRKNRLVLPIRFTPASYMDDIVRALGLTVFSLTPAIAALAESGIVAHGDPADRLIAATALQLQAPLITADEKLRAMPGLHCIW